MFKINGYDIKTNQEYLKNPRTKITSTIRSDYWKEYKGMMDSVKVEYCKGFDIMLELLSEDEDLLQEFIDRVKNY